jgi:hypothetical protein
VVKLVTEAARLRCLYLQFDSVEKAIKAAIRSEWLELI